MTEDAGSKASGADIRAFVERFILDYLEVPEHNHLGPGTVGKAWADALVAFGSGADPMFRDLKQHAGAQHWTPLEAFTAARAATGAHDAHADIETVKGDDDLGAEDLTVISWALCQSDAAKDTNSRETRYPSENWARARMFGQECNNALHHALIAALAEAGFEAVAPALAPAWEEVSSEEYFVTSSWSERHIAHVCGLGTFGLAGGLITKRGTAVRFGSVIVRARVPVTPRPYEGPFDYCLYLSGGTCGRCVRRCPVGSVRKAGRDKEACSVHLGPAMRAYVESQFDFEGYACGLCQTGVPCESRIPGPEDVAS